MAFSLDPDNTTDTDIIEAVEAGELRGRVQMDGWGEDRCQQLVEELESSGYYEVAGEWDSHKALFLAHMRNDRYHVAVHCYQFRGSYGIIDVMAAE